MDILIDLLLIALRLFTLLLFARVLVSWVRVDPYHPIVRFLYDVTEPVLAPIRELLPPMGMIDLSPMVALVITYALRQLLKALFLR